MLDDLLRGVGGRDTVGDILVDGCASARVANDLVSALHEATRHVAAHPSETHNRQLHSVGSIPVQRMLPTLTPSLRFPLQAWGTEQVCGAVPLAEQAT
jgi:hypothetical protein